MRLDMLADADLDHLPYGVIGLDRDLHVVRFNATEQAQTGIQRWRALGRRFDELAPGPANRALADSVRAFAASCEPAVTLDHTFVRRGNRDAARIELSRGEAGRIYLAIRHCG
jgi:hypothetical protein